MTEIQQSLSEAEQTMREEGWILSNELLSLEPDSPVVSAFRLLMENEWDKFTDTITDNSALRFFNTERPDFSCAKDWADLAEGEQVTPYSDSWRIPPGLPKHAREFCREFRAIARQDVYDEGTSWPAVFRTVESWNSGRIGYDRVTDPSVCMALTISNPAVEKYLQQRTAPHTLLINLLTQRSLWATRAGDAVALLIHHKR